MPTSQSEVEAPPPQCPRAKSPRVIADVVLPTHPGGVISLRVRCCCFCGREHWHGAGSDPSQIASYFGGRAPHCLKPPHRDYVLVQAAS